VGVSVAAKMVVVVEEWVLRMQQNPPLEHTKMNKTLHRLAPALLPRALYESRE
jgi:hypothetical protein